MRFDEQRFKGLPFILLYDVHLYIQEVVDVNEVAGRSKLGMAKLDKR